LACAESKNRARERYGGIMIIVVKERGDGGRKERIAVGVDLRNYIPETKAKPRDNSDHVSTVSR